VQISIMILGLSPLRTLVLYSSLGLRNAITRSCGLESDVPQAGQVR